MTGPPEVEHASSGGRGAGERAWDGTGARRTSLVAGLSGALGLPDADLRGAFEHAPTGMAVVTPMGVLRACNHALGLLLGRVPQDLLGTTLFDRTHPDDLPLALAACASMREVGAAVSRVECRFVHADGSVLWASVSCSRMPEAAGSEPSLVMHVEDISERKALESQLVHRSLHDPLTGLPNRTLLFDRLEHALARRDRSSSPTCLFLLDLDGFKLVNDTHGHAVGDELLRHFAARLTGLLRPGDTAARLGGDEFVVLCEDTAHDRAQVIADRLRSAASRAFDLSGTRVVLSASVGMSTCTTDPEVVDDAAGLLRRADAQMYAEKRRRRSCGGPPPGQ